MRTATSRNCAGASLSTAGPAEWVLAASDAAEEEGASLSSASDGAAVDAVMIRQLPRARSGQSFNASSVVSAAAGGGGGSGSDGIGGGGGSCGSGSEPGPEPGPGPGEAML